LNDPTVERAPASAFAGNSPVAEARPVRGRPARTLRRGYGLHLKLAFAGAVALFTCIAVLSATLLYRQSAVLTVEIERASLELRRSMIERGVLLVEGTAAGMESAVAGYDFAFITDTVETMQTRNENLAYAFLINSAGVVIVHTDSRQVGSHAKRPGGHDPRFVRDEAGAELVEVSHPLVVGGREWGSLVLGFDLSPISARTEAAVARGREVLARSTTLAILVASMLALIGLAASVWSSRRLLSPLTQLAEDAAAIASGDLEQEIEAVHSSDEIGLLARQFEAMRRSIRDNVGELLVAKQAAEEATEQEKNLRAEIEEHSRLLESKVAERTAELEAINRRLTEYDRLKSEFLSNVSHELRTPLAAISSSAKIIQRYSDRDVHSSKRFSKVIIEESERLTRLINDLLDLSKIEAGKAEWEMSLIEDPAALLDHMVVTFRPLFHESGIALEPDAVPGLPAIRGDRDRLIQVFANLLSNALKFTPRGGTVRLESCRSVHDGAPALRVAVADNGPGIPESEREFVFERFRQGETGAKPRGTGLGLAICREVVLEHGGALWAEAREGGGTRMIVVLPAIAETAGAASDSSPSQQAAGNQNAV
jgi:signal transduction histidine kinase